MGSGRCMKCKLMCMQVDKGSECTITDSIKDNFVFECAWLNSCCFFFSRDLIVDHVRVCLNLQVLQFPPSLYYYMRDTLKRDMILVLNKVDLAPPSLVAAWRAYITHLFPDLHIVCFTSFPKKPQEAQIGPVKYLFQLFVTSHFVVQILPLFAPFFWLLCHVKWFFLKK